MSDDKVSRNDAIDAALRLDGDPRNLKAYYDDWAGNYDRDTGSVDYSAPAISARLLAAHLAEREARLLDAGCGTGLVGVELARRGFHRIDGFDLSEAMLAQARASAVYRELAGGIDIMQAAAHYGAENYDAVLSVGVFTLGHVSPAALPVLLGLVRPRGLLLITTRTHYYEQSDFQARVDALLGDGAMRQLQLLRDAPYNSDGGAHYWLFRRSGRCAQAD